MEVEDLWKQFVASGKIADYLRFVNGTRTEAAEEIEPEQMAGSEQEIEPEYGTKPGHMGKPGGDAGEADSPAAD